MRRCAQRGVDAVAGADERVVGDEVGGREAELAAALVAVRPPRPRAGTARRGSASRRSTSPAATRPRMWVEETISPSTSTSGTTRVSNSSCALQQLGVALAPCCRSGSSRRPRPARRRAADQHVVDELLGGLRGERRRRTGSPPARRTPRPAIRSRLTANDMSSFGAASGWIDRQRVRLEGEHGVGAADDLAVAEVHAVELADRDAARGAPLGVGEPGDDPSAAEAYDGLELAAARGSASAIRLPSSVSRTVPVRAAPAPRPRPWPARAGLVALELDVRAGRRARRAAGRAGRRRRPRRRTGRSPCAAAPRSRRRRGRRSASARRCPTSTRSRTAPARRRARAARARWTVTARSAISTSSPRARQLVGALAADLHRRVGRRALAHARPSAGRSGSSGTRPVWAISPSGSPVVERPAQPRDGS